MWHNNNRRTATSRNTTCRVPSRCGCQPIPWMNDSGFWIITRISGMKEMETLKIVTPMMSLMGVVGLPVVMFGAWLWPMS